MLNALWVLINNNSLTLSKFKPKTKINKIETEFEEFLYSIYDIHYASKDVIYLTTYLSDSYNYKLVVSYNYFMVCILRMLNMFEIDNGTPEVDFSINSAELTKLLEDKYLNNHKEEGDFMCDTMGKITKDFSNPILSIN